MVHRGVQIADVTLMVAVRFRGQLWAVFGNVTGRPVRRCGPARAGRPVTWCFPAQHSAHDDMRLLPKAQAFFNASPVGSFYMTPFLNGALAYAYTHIINIYIIIYKTKHAL